MDEDSKPSDNDIKTVLETHILPEGPLVEEALGLASLYTDRIRKLLSELPASESKQKAFLAIPEKGLVQEGLIPNTTGENS